MEKSKCNFCQHEWVSRVEEPLACPRCKRYNYSIKKEVSNGQPGQGDRSVPETRTDGQ